MAESVDTPELPELPDDVEGLGLAGRTIVLGEDEEEADAGTSDWVSEEMR